MTTTVLYFYKESYASRQRSQSHGVPACHAHVLTGSKAKVPQLDTITSSMSDDHSGGCWLGEAGVLLVIFAAAFTRRHFPTILRASRYRYPSVHLRFLAPSQHQAWLEPVATCMRRQFCSRLLSTIWRCLHKPRTGRRHVGDSVCCNGEGHSCRRQQLSRLAIISKR